MRKKRVIRCKKDRRKKYFKLFFLGFVIPTLSVLIVYVSFLIFIMPLYVK